MDDIVVRPTRGSDAARLADIWLDDAEYYAQLDPDAFRVPARPDVERVPVGASGAADELSLVAEIDGTVAGFLDARIVEPTEHAAAQMMAELEETRLIVDALIVERAWWRRGVGSALLHAAEEWGRARGASVASIDTFVRSPVSVPFYEEHMGYARRSISFRKKL